MVNPYIVDHHGAWKDGVVDALGTAPVSANGNIEQQVKPFIEWPYGKPFALVFEGKKELIVNVNAIFAGLPFEYIVVKCGIAIVYAGGGTFLCSLYMVISLGVS